MTTTHYLDTDYLDLEKIREITESEGRLALSAGSRERIERCRSFLEQKLLSSEELFYGINTGFGFLCDVRISRAEIEMLQQNLVQSHACGAGAEAPLPVVRLMLLLKIRNMAFGHSGVRRELVERLICFYNEDLLPVVYQQGSLGASGDLAPLAHLSLALIGMGEVHLGGVRMEAPEALRRLGLEPLVLQAKEGLALLNGTQFSTAFAVWNLLKAERLMLMADLCAALSLDAFHCRMAPFDERLHRIRPHRGQIGTAEMIRSWLDGSEIGRAGKKQVQDPYAFRCVPQVHGASRDALEYIRHTVVTELNSVTDNPNIFPEEGDILSGGNFHGQPVALAMDFLAIALAELGSISERRIFQLISGNHGLPVFLTENAGLHSGLMMPQYTAASIASQNKQLCTPASIDTIPSSKGQEDHVSMSANAATKAVQVLDNVETILAIEWMTAAQALEFRRPLRTSPALEQLLQDYRREVPRLEADRILSPDIQQTRRFLGGIPLSALKKGGG